VFIESQIRLNYSFLAITNVTLSPKGLGTKVELQIGLLCLPDTSLFTVVVVGGLIETGY